MKDNILIDTNVLIYGETNDNEEKHKKAIEIIENTDNICISIQNITEFSHNMIKKSNISSLEINKIILNYIKVFDLLYFDFGHVTKANSISRDYKLHFFDALLVATMYENNVSKIITENKKDFRKVPWIEVINPFK